MTIIPLINEFMESFNKNFTKNVSFLNIESKIKNIGDNFTINFYQNFINNLDNKFKYSKERKEFYNIKETRKKTLITSIGTIEVNCTSYYKKGTKERYVFLRDLLKIKAYQRLTNEAEYQLIKCAMEQNMSMSARNALRNTIVSRSTVSRKIKALNGSINEEITKSTNQPDVLYIEMDEIHSNLQHGGNKICPCAIVHEGYAEDFVKKRKKLKNVKYFASAKLSYKELWEVIYDYVDKKYDIDKFKRIFISGDGAEGIKNFQDCFPTAKCVLDPFHYYRKHLAYIFKTETSLSKIADEYIRNDKIENFKYLVKEQIKKYPNQENYMTKHMNYIINNIEGIKNQKDPLYIVHCSMEGHVSQAFARYITSSPYGFSIDGLDNKLKLLTYHANKHELTMEDYFQLKYGENNYEEINKKIKELINIKYDSKLTKNRSFEYSINRKIPKLDSNAENNKLKELISIRQEIYIV